MGTMTRSLFAAACALLAGAAGAQVQVPLTDARGWQLLEYRGIPAHKVRFHEAGLEIAVDASAMPLVHPLPKPMRVKAIRVRARLQGVLQIPAGRQGERKFDDYALRVGLVEPGERTLGVLERPFAAPWVRRLFELAPPGGGISRIHFFNVGVDPAQIGRRRQHPLSDLIVEQVVAAAPAEGRVDFVHALERPLEAVALWLSVDGDDTGSRFTILIERIELVPAP
jgi:hypothetical protein